MPSKKGDFAAVRASIAKAMNQPGYDGYDEDTKHTAGPVLVRLAWHASGTYDKDTDTGGSDGAGMRYEAEGGDPANAGLQHARVFLEPVKDEHPWITYADLWTLAGVVAIKEMGGPEIEWKAGRTDFVDDSKCPPRGRLPDGAQAAEHLRFIFYRMGFNDKDIVTLSGAHNLGRCHADRSGFEGPWVNNPTRFSNQYYVLLKKNDWKPKNWGERKGMPFQYSSASALGGEDLMMLPTDYALLEDEKFRPWVDAYAEDKDLFFSDFAKVFARLVELGVHRDQHGNYVSAEKKSPRAGAPDRDSRDGEGKPVMQINEARAKL